MKLNLGCGNILRKGFKNVDILDIKASNYVKADIRRLPFKDSSVDYVEMMSVLEHLPFREVASTLKEIYRVMKLGSEIVILTDNFDGVAIDWIRAVMAGRVGEEVMETVYGNQKHKGEFHKSAFNPRLLHEALANVGFGDIKIQNIPQNSPIPQFGTVPAQPDKFIRTDQLYARAIK
jgi:predicted SAM-dependent methyltransferase